MILFSLLAISGVTIYTATSTQIGFPYRPKSNVQRLPYLVCVLTFFQDI